MKNSLKLSRKITESSILIAFSIVLTLISLAKLPYGGSITLAAMFPLVLISYRHGVGFGALSGLVFGVIYQLISISILSYVTGWVSIIAVILLDYLLAFSAIALSGLVRNLKNQTTALVIGTLIGGVARYILHVISGCTVWAGLSIPTANALLYSIIYNATYMVPEIIITCIIAFYISTIFDFSSPKITINRTRRQSKDMVPIIVGTTILTGSLIFDIVQVFIVLQNKETGEFDFTNIVNVNWTLIGLVTFICLICFITFFAIYKLIMNNKENIKE